MSECGGEVVLTDFGCCWANSKFGFKCPYITEDVDKGGNAALMAPEVANATPGTMAKISLNSLLKKLAYLKCFLIDIIEKEFWRWGNLKIKSKIKSAYLKFIYPEKATKF